MSIVNENGKNVAVIGGRNFTDKEAIFSVLDKNRDKIKLLVSGGADGADSFAQEWAKKKGFPILIFYPRWYDENESFNRGAGFERNWDIIRCADVVMAWHDGVSKGTQNSIDIAKKLNKDLRIFNFTPVDPKEEVEQVEPEGAMQSPEKLVQEPKPEELVTSFERAAEVVMAEREKELERAILDSLPETL